MAWKTNARRSRNTDGFASYVFLNTKELMSAIFVRSISSFISFED